MKIFRRGVSLTNAEKLRNLFIPRRCPAGPGNMRQPHT
jgi:hypothetical protein